MPKVIEIISAHLVANGFGGLRSEIGCGCEADDLAPCSADCASCKPGYKHMDPRPGSEGEWAIWAQQEPPSVEQWNAT